MQSQNPLLDELAKAANAAVGIAQAAGEEARAAMRSQADRLAANMDLIRREEFEALKAEVAALRAEIATVRSGLKPGGEG
jgi:BMFP domain-containing protein YqiC